MSFTQLLINISIILTFLKNLCLHDHQKSLFWKTLSPPSVHDIINEQPLNLKHSLFWVIKQKERKTSSWYKHMGDFTIFCLLSLGERQRSGWNQSWKFEVRVGARLQDFLHRNQPREQNITEKTAIPVSGFQIRSSIAQNSPLSKKKLFENQFI